MSKRIKKIFEIKGKKLVTFTTGGDPDLNTSLEILKTIINNGIDIIEIGMPFSDPMADGPTIQESSVRSLANGTKINDIFELVINIRKSNNEIPIILMGYYNSIFNLGIDKYNEGDYQSSLDFYEKIFAIVPFDEEDQLKRGNITQETILYNSFFSSSKLKNDTKSKELLQKLIDINFNEPSIYIQISDIYKRENNIEKTIEYLSLGREMFEDDQSLINTEINLYIELGRTNELITKLGEAIELDPENSLLYFNRGTIYDQEGQTSEAEIDYLKASFLFKEKLFFEF